MTNIRFQQNIIQQNEEKFALQLASKVLEKPKLSIWMIMVPIIFVYYFYKVQKYSEGRKKFAKNYLVSHNRALKAVVAAMDSGRECNCEALAQETNIPESVAPEYTAMIRILAQHYQDLLRAEGDTWEALIRSVYKDQTHYLLFLNRLNTVEKQFNSALKPHLQETTEGVDDIVQRMEHWSEALRRTEAEKIFT
jgi:hypothetical protein